MAVILVSEPEAWMSSVEKIRRETREIQTVSSLAFAFRGGPVQSFWRSNDGFGFALDTVAPFSL